MRMNYGRAKRLLGIYSDRIDAARTDAIRRLAHKLRIDEHQAADMLDSFRRERADRADPKARPAAGNRDTKDTFNPAPAHTNTGTSRKAEQAPD